MFISGAELLRGVKNLDDLRNQSDFKNLIDYFYYFEKSNRKNQKYHSHRTVPNILPYWLSVLS